MGWNYPKRSGVRWADVAPWIRNLEDEGFRVRVVIALETLNKMRISVTLARRDETGAWRECMRSGRLVSVVGKQTVEQAALQALTELQGLIDVARNTPDGPTAHPYEPLPPTLP